MDISDVNSRELVISVVGLGYVGLPTAISLHNLGFKVNGIDISEKIVNSLRMGMDPLNDSTSELEIPVESEKWSVSESFGENIGESDIIIITVPTPIDNNDSPNLEHVRSASMDVLRNITSSGKVIILESTVFPGVTREIIGGIADEMGKNAILAYCPERVSPGETGNSVSNVSRIIGCDNEEIGKTLASLYSEMTSGGCTFVGKIEVAEAAKLIENVQRDIDIAFANELSIVLPMIGIDVEDVLEAASTKWNFHRHKPGIGVGGHCIPVDPYYYISLSERVGEISKISKSARELNRRMPEFAADEIWKILGEGRGRRALVLGYSYKPELGDCRETPVEPLIKNLQEKGVSVILFEPNISKDEKTEGAEWCENPLDVVCDIVIIATAHRCIVDLDWEKMLEGCTTKIIFDGRRVLCKDNMQEIGWDYKGIGVPK